MNSFLIIQTAFLGDVILATSVAEKLHQKYRNAKIDFLLRKGNESLLAGHPFIGEVIVLDKRKNKLQNLFNCLLLVRRKKYDCIINLQRFGSSGFISWLSGSAEKIGFNKNPFSFCYSKTVKHEIANHKHEIERNHELIADLTDPSPSLPKLYPTGPDLNNIQKLFSSNQTGQTSDFICIAPASVWFTKQFPKEKWVELINSFEENVLVFLVGGKEDLALCEEIRKQAAVKQNEQILENKTKTIINLAGKISLLETGALMQKAKMNFVNDSAPLHIASAMNAPVTAVFCSTVPSFGFGPLSKHSTIIQTSEKLNCRPCGLHGFNNCPKGHFKCALSIRVQDILPDGRGN